MQQEIGRQKIDQKLEYLYSKLPEQPTAVQGVYSLPKNLANEVLDTNFSQPSLQRVSDHIGYFLGLLNSVKITIGIESSDYMIAPANDFNRADQVGLYKVLGGYNREIQLTKKFRFRLKHILAILAHESTHHYLYYHDVKEAGESENEILTDIATAYLGLGGLLIDGYEPITWTSDHWKTFTASGYTTHEIKIGYLTPRDIAYAIIRSTELRRLKELASPLTLFYKIVVSFHLWKIRRHEGKSKRQIESMLKEINRAKALYDQSSILMQKVSKNVSQVKIPPEDAQTLVEIANALSLGEIKLMIERLSLNINTLKNSTKIEDDEISHLSSQIFNLSKTITYWHKVLSRYTK